MNYFTTIEKFFNCVNTIPYVGMLSSPVRSSYFSIVQGTLGTAQIASGLALELIGSHNSTWMLAKEDGVATRKNGLENVLHAGLNWVRGTAESLFARCVVRSIDLPQNTKISMTHIVMLGGVLAPLSLQLVFNQFNPLISYAYSHSMENASINGTITSIERQ